MKVRSLLILLLLLCAVGADALSLYRQAENLHEEGRFLEAAVAYEEYAARRPESELAPAALLSAAWEYVHADHPDSAALVLSKLEMFEWRNRVLDLYIFTNGVVENKRHNSAAAARHFNRLLSEFPASRLANAAQFELAKAHAGQRRNEDALATLEKVAAPLSNTGEYFALKYSLLLNEQDYEGALKSLRRLLEMPELPPNVAADELLYDEIRLRGRLEMPEEEALENYLERFPKGKYAARVHRRLAELSDDPTEELNHYRAAAALGDVQPFASENISYLGDLYIASGGTSLAINAWKRVVLEYPQSYEASLALENLARFPQAANDREFRSRLELFLQESERHPDEFIDAIRMYLGLAPTLRTEEYEEPIRKAPAVAAPEVIVPLAPPETTEREEIIEEHVRPPSERRADARPRLEKPVSILVLPPQAGTERGREHLKSLEDRIRRELDREPHVVRATSWNSYLKSDLVAMDLIVSISSISRGEGITIEVELFYEESKFIETARFIVADPSELQQVQEVAAAIANDILRRIR